MIAWSAIDMAKAEWATSPTVFYSFRLEWAMEFDLLGKVGGLVIEEYEPVISMIWYIYHNIKFLQIILMF